MLTRLINILFSRQISKYHPDKLDSSIDPKTGYATKKIILQGSKSNPGQVYYSLKLASGSFAIARSGTNFYQSL